MGEYIIGIDTEGTIFALKPGAWNRMPFGSFQLDGVVYPALDMTYDVKNDVLYVLTDELTAGEGGHLVTLDYLSGEVTDLGVITGFEGDESNGKSAQGLTLAADNDGILYSINYNNGDLYTIGPATCEATFVGATGYDPSGMQSMTVDHDSNKLYWAAYQGYTGTSVFFEVGKTDGKLIMVCQPQYNSEITALLKPYEVDGLYPEAVAPRALLLSESKVYTTVGSTVEVSCTPDPYYAERESLTWSSNDETVATVNNGTITANAVGETVITVTCGNVYAELTVIVNAYAGELTYFDMGMNYLWMKSNVANPAGAEIYENGQTSNYGFTAAAYANGYVYAADYDNLFYRLNPETMAGEKLGSTDGLTLAMTFNYADGYMYAIQQAGSFWDVFYYLVRINLATGESQQLHQFDVASTGTPIGGLAADYEGNIRLLTMKEDYDTWEMTYEMHTIRVTDGENGAEVGFADPISLPIGFYNYCSLVYSAENGGYFWADDMGTLYHIDVTDPTAPVVVPLGMIAEELGGAWPLAMFMIPENEPETNYAEPTSIAIPSSYQLLAGGSVSVGLIVMPWNANVSAAYTTENPNVATVSADGIITGVAEGTTTLAVYISELDVTLEAPVTVLPSAGTIYGHVILDFANYGSDFYGAFSDTNPADCQLLDINPYAQGYADYDAPEVMSILAGAYYDGQLYAYMQVMDNATYQVSYNMGIINLTDYSYEKLAVSAYTVRDMEFDYTTGKVYLAGIAASEELWIYNTVIAEIDLTTGEVTPVLISQEVQAANLLVTEGTAYMVDCFMSGMLTTCDLTSEDQTLVQQSLVPGYWGEYYNGRSFIMDELTGEVYVIRDLAGGESILNTLTLASGAIYGMGVIAEGIVANSLILK